jgi:hypothetical protein
MGKASVVTALRMQREATLRRLDGLDHAGWELRCTLPAGAGPVDGAPRVRDIAAHLVLADGEATRGRVAYGVVGRRRLRSARRWDPAAVGRIAALDPADIVALLRRRGEQLVGLAAATPAVLAGIPLGRSGARLPLTALLERRVLHEWGHDHDIALATGCHDIVPVPPTAEVADALVSAALCTLTERVLPAMDRTVGVVRLAVEVGARAGAVAEGRRVWGVDFARRQYGPRVVSAPDARIETTAVALALMAERRMDWCDTGDLVGIDGDADLAAALLDGLAGRQAPPSAGLRDVLGPTGTDG